MAKPILQQVNDGYLFNGHTAQFTVPHTSMCNPLGKGAFGTVYEAYSGQQKYALKQISKSCGIPIPKLRFELNFMELAAKVENAGNVLCTIDSAEDDCFIYLIMQYYDSDTLTKFINKGIIKSELEAIEYFRQICYGLKTLHSIPIIHRDLKTDNILANSYKDPLYPYPYLLAIADYGLSTNEKDMLTKCVGTGYTMAPEVKTGVYDQKADVFSMGCILYKMLSKGEPFNGVNQYEIDNKKKMKSIEIKPYFVSQQHFSKLTMKVLEGCLQTDKNKRLSMAELNALLDIDSLYTKYTQIKLDEPDSNNTINLCEFVRAYLHMPTPKTEKLNNSPPRNIPAEIKYHKIFNLSDKMNIPPISRNPILRKVCHSSSISINAFRYEVDKSRIRFNKSVVKINAIASTLHLNKFDNQSFFQPRKYYQLVFNCPTQTRIMKVNTNNILSPQRSTENINIYKPSHNNMRMTLNNKVNSYNIKKSQEIAHATLNMQDENIQEINDGKDIIQIPKAAKTNISPLNQPVAFAHTIPIPMLNKSKIPSKAKSNYNAEPSLCLSTKNELFKGFTDFIRKLRVNLKITEKTTTFTNTELVELRKLAGAGETIAFKYPSDYNEVMLLIGSYAYYLMTQSEVLYVSDNMALIKLSEEDVDGHDELMKWMISIIECCFTRSKSIKEIADEITTNMLTKSKLISPVKTKIELQIQYK